MLSEKVEKEILDFSDLIHDDPVTGEYDSINYMVNMATFQVRCYQKYTVSELIKYLKKNKQYDVATGIIMYQTKVLNMANRAGVDTEACHLFSTMYVTCEEILDFVLSKGTAYVPV